MATNLTGTKVKDTYNQLLHVDGGVEASEKVVRTGTGTASALSLGTGSVSVDNLKFDGNTISSTDTNGNIILSPNGSGAVQTSNLQLGNILISGNTLASTDTNGNITLAPNGNGDVQLNADTVRVGDENAATTITNWGATAGALNITTAANNANIALTPHGTGEVQISKIAVTAGTVPYNTLTGRAYAAFSDITDQTGSTSTPTAIKFGTTDVAGSGITMVTDGSNLTRLTFAAAGTYAVCPNIQLFNSDASDHDVTIWFRLDGVDIARSATKVTVPKTGDGGSTFFQILFYVTVTANQYVQVMWLPENVAVTLDHTAAVTGPPAIPAIPSTVIVAERIA